MGNRARCKNCSCVIESKTTHDWVCCSCFSNKENRGIFIDGGKDYWRGGGNLEHFERLQDDENEGAQMDTSINERTQVREMCQRQRLVKQNMGNASREGAKIVVGALPVAKVCDNAEKYFERTCCLVFLENGVLELERFHQGKGRR